MSVDLPKYCTAEVLVLGCGNPLVGDDGFGPAVAEKLLERRLPRGLCVINAETGSRSIIFDLAAGKRRPQGIIIVDALNGGRKPGAVFEAYLNDLTREKADDFTLHLTPVSNMLVDLGKMGVTVRILACQPAPLPDRIMPGLSKDVEGAIDGAARRVLKMAAEIVIGNARSLIGTSPKKKRIAPRKKRPGLAIHAPAMRRKGKAKGREPDPSSEGR